MPQCILNKKVKITAKRFSASFSKNILPFYGTGCTVSRKSQFQREKLRTVSKKDHCCANKGVLSDFPGKEQAGILAEWKTL